ncbi:hypothetical protein THOM_0833, partial [Trachipleistophora hominis]
VKQAHFHIFFVYEVSIWMILMKNRWFMYEEWGNALRSPFDMFK